MLEFKEWVLENYFSYDDLDATDKMCVAYNAGQKAALEEAISICLSHPCDGHASSSDRTQIVSKLMKELKE